MRAQAGSLGPFAFSRDAQDDFAALLTGKAEAAPTGSPLQTNDIYGLGIFAMSPAVVSSSDQLRGKRMILRKGENAEVGA